VSSSWGGTVSLAEKGTESGQTGGRGVSNWVAIEKGTVGSKAVGGRGRDAKVEKKTISGPRTFLLQR